ncbi:MAG: Fur family transcriptional regulator [Candidatus Izemoplasmataceae bacterium]
MDTATLLKQVNIKPSYTRMMIYEYLKNNLNHPTVDDIYQDLMTSLPTLSKTTVYNTLKLLMDKHLVNELVMEQQKHYDLVSTPHAHFQCERCNTIYDIEMIPPSIDPSYLHLYQVHQAQLMYKGLCSHCKNTSRA